MNTLRLKTRVLTFGLALMIGLGGLITIAPKTTLAEDEDTKETAIELVGQSRGYSAVLYNNSSGLPTSEANAIAQTPEGFIWIGCYSGLIRYDGSTFERIDSASTGITSVVSLLVDSGERLWVGTNDNGVGIFERGEWRTFTKQDGLPSASVRSIVEDENGLIYLGTTEGIVLVDEDLNLKRVEDEKIRSEYIRTLKLGYGNVIYALTVDGALFTMKEGSLIDYYTPQDLGVSDIHAIFPDPDKPDYLYCGTKGADVYYGMPGQSFSKIIETIEPFSYVNSICKFDQEVWVCTDNGIGRIVDGQLIPLENVPMTSSVEDIMADYQHNLWFVSSQQGVMKIVPNRFSDIYSQYRLDNDVVYSTALYQQKLFIGTKTSGLIVLEKNAVVDSIPLESTVTASGENLGSNDLLKLLSGSKLRSIIKDSKGNLWICSFSDYPLVRYDGKSAVVFSSKDGLPSDRVRTAIELSDGSIAVACTGGIAVISSDKITNTYGEAAGIRNTEVLTVAETEKKDLLVGTDGGGIYVISGGKTRHISTDDGLLSDVILRIKKDHQREVYWVVTSNSISYLNSDYEVTTIKKFPYSNNFDIYQNQSDEMWVLSSNGIYVLPTEEMLENEIIAPFFYGSENGLSCFATSNSYSELTEEGDLYISGSTGVVLTNIDEPNEIETDVNICVPFVSCDGTMLYPDEDGAFVIPADVQKVTVYAYCFNYSLVNPQIIYCMEGFDRTSTTVRRTGLKPISYTNLAGGKYTFRLQLLKADGQVQKEVEIKITKKLAHSEQVWYKALSIIGIVVIVMGGAYLITRKRMRALKEKDQNQRTLIREIVEAFAKVIDMKDRYTNGHSARVAKYTAMLTEELGYDDETVEMYRNIALLHDIGKIGISSETLNKPGRLTDEEFKEIKSHSGKGYAVLKDISIMPELAIGARDHHERPDGRGYPKGLKGDEIPRVAQIIAVADTFDAMYSDRPYRKRMNFEKVISIIQEASGTQLQEDVVDAFLRLVERGEFRAEDDNGGGTFEDITNIHKKQEQDFAKETSEASKEERRKEKTEAPESENEKEILKKDEEPSEASGKSDKSEEKEQQEL